MKYPRSLLIFAPVLLCTLMLAGALAHDEKRGEVIAPLPFEPAEELVYEGEISKSLLRGLNIAELRFTASRLPDAPVAKSSEGSAVTRLRFTAEAVTKGLFRKLFGLRFRQRIESTVEPTSFTVLQTTKLDEQGERRRTSEAVFDRSAGKVVWTERDPNNPAGQARVVTSQFSGPVQDVASVFYFIRTQQLIPGKSIEIPVSDSGRIYRMRVHVVEKKRMKTVLGEVWTVRVDPEMFGQERLVRGKGQMSIWFTDDARHIPVQARISSGMGTLNIKLKSVTHGASAKTQ